MRINELLFGCARVTVKREDTVTVMNILMREKTVYRELFQGEDITTFLCTKANAKKICRLCRASDVMCSYELLWGLPISFQGYKKRYGMLLGVALFFALIIFGSSVIWSISVSGNQTLSSGEIREMLRPYGLYVGASRASLDISRIQNLTEIENSNIAWISVNVRGTVAYVELKEQVDVYGEGDGHDGANLIADRDAMVESVELICGKPLVTPGCVVRKGDLLVSGVTYSDTYGMYITSAEGRIIGQTSYRYTIEIPLEYEKKVPSSDREEHLFINFFSKRIKISKKGGLSTPKCDTIKEMNFFSTENGRIVPVGLEKHTYVGYEIIPATRTPDEARRLAYFELMLKIGRDVGDGTLLRKSISTSLDDQKLVLECDIVALQNIAQVQRFNVTDTKD